MEQNEPVKVTEFTDRPAECFCTCGVLVWTVFALLMFSVTVCVYSLCLFFSLSAPTSRPPRRVYKDANGPHEVTGVAGGKTVQVEKNNFKDTGEELFTCSRVR